MVKTRPRTQISDTIFHEVKEDDHQVFYPEVVNLRDQDVELIKEVLRSVNRSGNILLAFQAQQKVEQVLAIKSKHPDSKSFLNAVLVDYNFITSGL